MKKFDCSVFWYWLLWLGVARAGEQRKRIVSSITTNDDSTSDDCELNICAWN